MDELGAAVTVGEKAGRALVGPFHGATELLRGVQDAGVLGIVQILHPERAADIRGQHADLFRRHIQDSGDDCLVARDALGRDLDGVALALSVVLGESCTRLHRHHRDAGVDHIELGHVGSGGKGGLDFRAVAVMEIERDIVGNVIIELGRAGLCGLGGVGHGRQRLDIDLDGFGGITRLCQRLRDHERHGITDKADLVDCKRHAVGLQQRRAVAVPQRKAANERLVVGAGQIGSRPHPKHAGHHLGGCRIDPLDDPMGMAGADNPGIGLARQREIVGILALAAHERVVFLAADGLSDAMFLQCNSVFDGLGRGQILHRKRPDLSWI